MYTQMWADLATMQASGVQVLGMLGGAENSSYIHLSDDYDSEYAVLKQFVTEYKLDGLDLDVETSTSLSVIENLITDLKTDFGPDFLITMSPVATELQGEGGLSGFDYDELYADHGEDIAWFNAQFYCGWEGEGIVPSYTAIMEYTAPNDVRYPADKVDVGTFTNESGCSGYVPLDELQTQLKSLIASYPTFGGVSGWEYIHSLPEPYTAPWIWFATVDAAMNPVTPDPTPAPDPAPTTAPAPGAPSQPALANTGSDGSAGAIVGVLATAVLGAGLVLVRRARIGGRSR
jgi:LPXTG-motif cell wall-anchored protein